VTEIGRVGIWTGQLDSQPAAKTREVVAELEDLGYPTIWLPESRGRESFAHAGLLLAATRRLVVATGITNMYGRDPMAMAAAQRTLAEAYPDRFLLGIGVSHAPTVEGLRGHRYDRPVAAMRAYLDAMDAAPFWAAPPAAEPPRVLAALGPRMLRLAAERARGAHPYFVPVEHTALARDVLGSGPLLAPEQAVVLETDPRRAREVARAHTSYYLGLTNYANNLRRLGFAEDDLANGGSDRLVDAIVAWGEAASIVQRVREHFDAGADHVSIQVLLERMPQQAVVRRTAPGDGSVPRGVDPVPLPEREWRELAPALLAL
jgi:probable F420-dependent oxidoreductase